MLYPAELWALKTIGYVTSETILASAFTPDPRRCAKKRGDGHDSLTSTHTHIIPQE